MMTDASATVMPRPRRPACSAGTRRTGCAARPSPSAPDGLAEDIADAAHRMDQARFALGFRLPPQVADVHLERVGVGPEVVTPDPVEDQLAGEHLARVAQQQLQQEELRARQLDASLATEHLAGAGIEGEVAEAQHLVVRRRSAPAEQGADPGEQL